jgi:hypothetical protein
LSAACLNVGHAVASVNASPNRSRANATPQLAIYNGYAA